MDVTSAHLDLIAATNKADAEAAGETLRQFDPPSEVSDAIDHFVSTEGAQFDDPDFKSTDEKIKVWVAQICPT